MIVDGGEENRATFTTTYLMSSSSLGRGICCKVDANCLTLSSSRGDCCHSNQRRFGASEVRSGCPGGRTGKQDTTQLGMVSNRHKSPLRSYTQIRKEGGRERGRERGREGGRERGREGGRERGREGVSEEGRE